MTSADGLIIATKLTSDTTDFAWFAPMSAKAEAAADLITAIALGAADQLTGRILHPRDDLSALTAQCQSQPGRRRLRLDLS